MDHLIPNVQRHKPPRLRPTCAGCREGMPAGGCAVYETATVCLCKASRSDCSCSFDSDVFSTVPSY